MNTCCECKACCVILPIAETELAKPAGVQCQHLCENGCGIYGTTEWPKLCREYLCGWRREKWMNQRPLYRLDKLGVIFQCDGKVLALFEVMPGSLPSQQAEYIKRRLRGAMMVTNYPAGTLDGI